MEQLNELFKIIIGVFSTPGTSWWFWFLIGLPSAIIIVAWLYAAFGLGDVPESNAWNECGKRWSLIGWVLFGSECVLYIISVILLSNVWVMGAVCGLAVFTLWTFIAFKVFISHGDKMRKNGFNLHT